MKEKPILFSGEMVRAILDGRKSQTRRIIKPGSGQKWLTADTLQQVRRWWTMAVGDERRIVHCGHEMDGGHIGSVLCPYGQPGDRLMVKETHVIHDVSSGAPDLAADHFRARVTYAADSAQRHFDVHMDQWRTTMEAGTVKKRPSIFMFRWASRIVLEVASVRVERLQDISEEDAKAEGAEPYVYGHGPVLPAELLCEPGMRTPTMYRDGFRELWNSINGAGAWDVNPWVWVVEFKRVQ